MTEILLFLFSSVLISVVALVGYNFFHPVSTRGKHLGRHGKKGMEIFFHTVETNLHANWYKF